MKKPTFYEQVGIVIPGAVLLFGLLFYFPSLRDLLAKDNVTIGQLGIYVLLSYAAGNLVAALGNLAEKLWSLVGGMPTDWLVKAESKLLSPQQVELVREKLGSRLKIELKKIIGLERKVWWPILRQIYADVARHGKPDRIDTFNGNYGLNRGLASACVLLACIAATQQNWGPFALLVVLSLVYGYRAYRFGVHYGRELYIQFLTIDGTAKTPTKKKAEAAQ